MESPEALNAIKDQHIQSVISFLDKHGCNHRVVFRRLLCVFNIKIRLKLSAWLISDAEWPVISLLSFLATVACLN